MTYYVYPQGRKRSAVRKERKPRARLQREVNPDTGKPFRDPRSKITGDGRVICKGADYSYLRERVGIREGEICQIPTCQAYAPIYPPEGTPPGENHHIYGRGMGSGKRDDRAAKCEWLCSGCHKKRKIEPGYGILAVAEGD